MSENSWKLTEKKYRRLRGIVCITCLVYIIFLILMVKYAMKINPDAFMYNPIMDADPPFAKLESTLWWLVGGGFIVITILFIREVKQDKDHWLRKFIKLWDGLDDRKD